MREWIHGHGDNILGVSMLVLLGVAWLLTWREQRIKKPVNVRDQGAKCDGATDDTDAIHAALDALCSAPKHAPIGRKRK